MLEHSKLQTNTKLNDYYHDPPKEKYKKGTVVKMTALFFASNHYISSPTVYSSRQVCLEADSKNNFEKGLKSRGVTSIGG